MEASYRVPEPGSYRWLWKTALVILVLGGAAIWAVEHFEVRVDEIKYRFAIFAWAFSIALCVICATAGFWMKR